MSISGTQLDPEFYKKGAKYWQTIEPTIDGMLGGFPQVTCADTKASMRFLDQYFMDREKKKELYDRRDDQKQSKQLSRALDCGSGIGRVSKHLLLKYFDCVDQLEQNQKFLNETKAYLGPTLYKRIGNQYNTGLQDFIPDPTIKYDCIWCQWVIGFVTDDDLIQFLIRCKSALKEPNGIVVVKDNITSSDECDDDHKDGSVTRPHWLLLDIFKRANLTVLCDRKQYKMPKGLYPVRMIALK